MFFISFNCLWAFFSVCFFYKYFLTLESFFTGGHDENSLLLGKNFQETAVTNVSTHTVDFANLQYRASRYVAVGMSEHCFEDVDLL